MCLIYVQQSWNRFGYIKLWGERRLNIFPPIVQPNIKMKGETNTIKEKNPYKYNGESTHISPHSKALLNTDNQQLTNNKKVYIECYVC